MRANLNQRLIESGEKERLKDLLRTKLVECGWRDELKVREVEPGGPGEKSNDTSGRWPQASLEACLFKQGD